MRYLSKSESSALGERVNMRAASPLLELLAALAPHIHPFVALAVFLLPFLLLWYLLERFATMLFPNAFEWVCRVCRTSLDADAAYCPVCHVPLREGLARPGDR